MGLDPPRRPRRGVTNASPECDHRRRTADHEPLPARSVRGPSRSGPSSRGSPGALSPATRSSFGSPGVCRAPPHARWPCHHHSTHSHLAPPRRWPAAPAAPVRRARDVRLGGRAPAAGVARAGTTYYVSTTGNDAARRLELQPVAHDRPVADAPLRPATRSSSVPAPYSERITAPKLRAGTSALRIKVAAYPGERPVIQGLLWLHSPSYWTFDGISVTWSARELDQRAHGQADQRRRLVVHQRRDLGRPLVRRGPRDGRRREPAGGLADREQLHPRHVRRRTVSTRTTTST
jgi:hypothetical protein